MLGKSSFLMAAAVGVLALAMAATAHAQSAPSANTWATRYDLGGKVVGTIAPDPDGSGPLHYAATRNSYDNAGRLISTEKGELAAWQSDGVAPSSWTGFTVFQTVYFTYDTTGRKVQEELDASDGSAVTLTQYSYNSVGLLECTALRMKVTAYGALPSSACALGSEGTQGPDRITKNIYDAAGQRIEIHKALGTNIQQAYAIYSYTPNGKLEYVIDANGNRAKLEYDGFDRQSKWIFPSNVRPTGYYPATQASALATAGSLNTGDFEQYGYDANGNRTSLRKRDGMVLNWQFDALNRPALKIVPERSGLSTTHTRDVYYSYDVRGLMTAARFDSANGEGVTTAYDGFGRITSSTLAMDGVSRTLTYAYDADGNRTRITHPDNIPFWTCYDGLDRANLSWMGGTVTCPGTASGATQFVDIDFNAAGARAKINRASSFTDYSYEVSQRINHLTQRFAGNVGNVTHDFAYNPASQITSLTTGSNDFVWTGTYNVNRNYTANGLNQYTAAGSASFAYDANGNLVSDGSTSFVYDVENRLVSASGAKNATLRYDPMGRLYEIGGGSGVTRFLNDGDHLVAEYASGGQLLRRYFWGPGADEPILWAEGSGTDCSTLKFLHQNYQGSIIALANCNGNRVGVNTYDEYGIPAVLNQGRFQYTGQAWLPDLGMSYYKARMYSPTLGRFMQTDPIGYKDQINLYAYVANDSVNGIDPTGTDSWLVSRATPYGAGHMFVVVTDPESGQVIARYSFGPNGPTFQSLIFQTKLVSVTGANEVTNRTDQKAWASIQSGKPNGASAVRIQAGDSAVISAGKKVNAVLGTLEKPGNIAYTFYGANSNAAAYAVADMAVKSAGGGQGTQPVPGDQYHPGDGAYRQVEAAAEQNANQRRAGPSPTGSMGGCTRGIAGC